ncbi:hypothetical protein HAX54_008992 [Datura stramonium]|uniref:Uncharacterized protein n=1 Tax=Datura stramonium TaxID=4076 RepID=A0ABS8TFI8_DATST|nr:hypothetical protein [Datura stramonium]
MVLSSNLVASLSPRLVQRTVDSNDGSLNVSVSDEGEGVESNNEDPPTNDVEEGDNDAEESGDDESAVEESATRRIQQRSSGSRDVYYVGLALIEKGNPRRSIQEEPRIRTNALNDVQKLKRIFDAYNIHGMTKKSGKYGMEMVLEFFANYFCTLENNAPSRNAIKKEPVLDSVRVRAYW